MGISEEEVLHVAGLAKLELDSDEVESFKDEFNKILGMVEEMNEVETDNVEIMTYGNRNHNVMRKDVADGAMDREDLFKNAKSGEDGFIKVPAILDNEEGDA